MVTMSKPQQKLGNKQAYAQCCCLGSLRLFRVARPKLVYARNKIQPPRGCNMEEVGAASSELMRPLSAKLVCRFQNHLALQIRLPTQTRLRAFRGPKSLPGSFAMGIHARLPQIVPKFVPEERPIHEVRRRFPYRVGQPGREFVLGMEESEERRRVS